MTAPLALERQLDRAEQLQQLRRQMAAVSGKVGSRWREPDPARDATPDSESLLPVPEFLTGLLPGGLPRGTVAVLSGARSVPVGMAASVSAAGGHVAVVGVPEFGVLAAVEMGADLSRLAMIPNPGADPVEIAAVLMDGMDLVVLGLGGRRVPMTRARAVIARARQRGCSLLVTQGDWQGAGMRMDARVCGYDLTADPGFGRIGAVRVSVRAR